MTTPAHELRDLGNGLFAYLHPSGSWGWSNAGLVADGDQSLLVDTLFDLKLTGAMLDTMREACAAARKVDTLVNTHANGDHCYGNQLVGDATIIASSASAEEMDLLPPETMAQLVANAPKLGAAGEYFAQIFGEFEFAGIRHTPPTQTFETELALHVGDKEVRLLEVGPAHTRGDVIVHVPDDRVVFSGDILFIGGTPIIWEGPVGNWIRACERIVDMDPVAVVPGHGPVTDSTGVLAVRDYLVYIRDEARGRFDAGLSVEEAARDISLGTFAAWGEAERIAVNVDTLYREFSGSDERRNPLELFELMAELAR